MSLSAEAREAARDEWDRLARSGPDRDPKVSGCFVAFAGMVILTLTPAVGGWLDIPPGLALGILVLAVLLLLGGAALGLIGGGRQERDRSALRQASLEALGRWDRGEAEAPEAARAAVGFLFSGGGAAFDSTTDLSPASRALVEEVARSRLTDTPDPPGYNDPGRFRTL